MNETDYEQLRQAGNAPDLVTVQAALIKQLEAQIDAANAAMLIYREFYEVARDADRVSELLDSTNYDHDTLNLWVDAIEAVKKIRALEGKAE